eukprot:TRINITY_DN3539_c0_g2_i2.p1 TRINITY_DN3539_c0_g2~~TRINITY_DN3539_c0_g2_i2.p1  ORF type:complete len:521 (+),score=154.66 TRINITY_DN3539_c0_g2_i2:176-1738(+)
MHGPLTRRSFVQQLENASCGSVSAAGIGGDKTSLATEIIAEHFGALPGVVAARLMLHGPCNLLDLIEGCRVTAAPGVPPPSAAHVQSALVTLVTHGVVGFQAAPGSATMYFGSVDSALVRLCHPLFLQYAQDKCQDEGWHLVNLLLRHGRLTEHSLLSLCADQAPYARLPQRQHEAKRASLQVKLQELIKLHFVEVVPIPGLEEEPAQTTAGSKKRPGKQDGPPAKRAAVATAGSGKPAAASTERSRLLRVNVVQFLVLMRQHACRKAVEGLCGMQDAAVCDVLFKQQHHASRTEAGSLPELTHPCIPKLPATSAPQRPAQLMQALDEAGSALSRLEMPHPQLAGRSIVARSSGDYVIDQDSISEMLRQEHLLRLLDQAFSPPTAPTLARRILQVLSQKYALDDTMIAHQVLAPAQDVRRLLMRMLTAGIVHVREVNAPSNREPQNCVHLWSSPPGAARMRLTEIMCKRTRNLYTRLRHVRCMEAGSGGIERRRALDVALLRLAAAVSAATEQLIAVEFF